MKRRNLILGALGLAGAGWLLRPADKGASHSEYFRSISGALSQSSRARPTLVIDRAAMRQNVRTLQGHLADRFAYRIVAKSLPSLPLLQEVMTLSGSQRLMLFNQPFINQVASAFPQADVLLGKPLPVAAAGNFYRTHQRTGGFDPQQQLHWLLDSPQRAQQYEALAAELGETLSVCIEIDVGLHRGGVSDDADMLAILDRIRRSPQLNFKGLMGYEPHVAKVPGYGALHGLAPMDAAVRKVRDSAMERYRHYLALARQSLGDDWPDNPVLNAGGSPTYQLYDSGEFPFNELSAGSCLVKPSDFDLPTLADHTSASYIAAPVLKAMDHTRLPIVDLGRLQSLWDPNRERAFFTDGGYWKARPVSPPGLSPNAIYGRSTNQEMLNGSASVNLAVDDWVFLRPTQSEFVFLQFGDIAVFEQGRIVERWPVFSVQA
ncbi:DSD1 family PLP-dependent enzyme [Seongchinamella unica]|uniref:DSD1 family PLP-dependent enzyme n=1 Tax=Seongchinamella unica TaxID=2547392 RepID=A0A4R5LS45_9GAMM|nr:DSD1 family PLP-dependent enzyme [Seongchinamella unica]TDG13636.1 DSD1 family PLP-dependent enzyme [Seongchinamella unica]